MTKIKLSEIRELVREIIKEEMGAYEPAPEDEKDTEEEKPPHPALVEKHTEVKNDYQCTKCGKLGTHPVPKCSKCGNGSWKKIKETISPTGGKVTFKK